MTKAVRIFGALLVMLVAAVVFWTTAVHALVANPDVEVPLAKATPAPLLHPIHVSIPSINVSAAVEELGVNAAGRMAVPRRFDEVGWYKYGPAPGEPGRVVMYGHLDNGLGLDGAFINLHKIQPGDAISIEAADGKKITYVVDALTNYPYKAVPEDALADSSTGSSLVLITCSGHWVKDPRMGWTYDHRLLVTAHEDTTALVR